MRYRAMSLHSLYSMEIFPADYRFYHKNNEIGQRYFVNSVQIKFIIDMLSSALALFIANQSGNAGRYRIWKLNSLKNRTIIKNAV